MLKSTLIKFSIANAFRRKGIAILAICGTALGIALMTVLLSMSNGMDAQIGETMNELAGGIDVYPAGQMIPSTIGMPSSYIEEIDTIEHVKTVSSEVLAFISTKYADFGDPAGVTLRGLGLEQNAAMDEATVHIIEGRTIKGANEVILGSGLASGGMSMGPSGGGTGDQFKVGDTIVIPVLGGKEITLTVVGIFETDNMITNGYIYSDMDTARSLIPALGAGEVNYIHVEADSTSNVEAVAADIEAMFTDAKVPVSTVVSKEMVDTISATMSTFTTFLWVISLVAAVAGGVSIFIVMLISVMERMKEFGILKAAGWSNGNIIGSVVVQSITVSLLGTVSGLLVGGLVGLGINAMMPERVAVITWSLVLIIAVFGMIMGVVGGLYPALRAARVSPIESIRAI